MIGGYLGANEFKIRCWELLPNDRVGALKVKAISNPLAFYIIYATITKNLAIKNKYYEKTNHIITSITFVYYSSK